MTVQTPLRRSHTGRRAVVLAVGLVVLLGFSPAPAVAEPSPTPSADSASPLAPATPTTTPTATPADAPATPTPAPSSEPTPAGTPAARGSEAPGRAAAEADADTASLTLAVAAKDSPLPGRYFQDVGSFALRGTATGIADGATVEIFRHSATSTTWTRAAQASVVAGAYTASVPVQGLGLQHFAATTGGAPGSGDEVASPVVQANVEDATVTLDRPVATIDSLKNPTLTGFVVPARAGVEVHVDVLSGKSWKFTNRSVTDAAGRFRTTFSYGKGKLATYTLRSTYRAPTRDRWEISGSRKLGRVAVLNAVVTATTAAEVAKTYRSGCPVGRSKLSTVTMNFYGRDKVMHRGVLIIRTDLVPEVKRAFTKAMAARYPVAKMNNPNVYNGHDPTQMEANNTSGFNCRKVVGNPYAQSPHSYGIAIDVNTVQNPYRDSRGKWWPSNGKSYIDRTPLRFGMLSTGSTLTKQLRSDGFFWGGLWSPGRDYQHFEYRR